MHRKLTAVIARRRDSRQEQSVVYEQTDDERDERNCVVACGAECLGSDVKVIGWMKRGKTRISRQTKTEQRKNTMKQISEFRKTYMRAITKLVTMSIAVPARTWVCHALAFHWARGIKHRAQVASTAGETKNNVNSCIS